MPVKNRVAQGSNLGLKCRTRHRGSLLDLQAMVFKNSLDAVLILDTSRKVLDLNRTACELLQMCKEKAIGRSIDELFLKGFDQNRSLSDIVQRVVRMGTPARVYEVQESPFYDSLSRLVGQMVLLRDITEIKQHAGELSTLLEATRAVTSTLKLEDVMAAIAWQMILALDMDSCTLSHWDQQADAVVTWIEEQRVPHHEKDEPGTIYKLINYPTTRTVLETCQPRLVMVSDPDADPTEVAYMRSIQVGTLLMLPLVYGSQVFGLVELDLWDEERRIGEDSIRLGRALADQAAIAIQNARLFEEIQRISTTDALTGLYNRRSFFDLAEQEFRRAFRYRRPLTVCMMDVDKLKYMNDTYGHVVGDQVLMYFANKLRWGLRTIDLIGRYGGDEFIVLMPETELASAHQASERLLNDIVQDAQMAGGLPESVSCSIGLASLNENCTNLEVLLKRADEVLYQAKNSGRNQVILWKEK